MNHPLVSICIPTYNGEKYLQETLDSVRHQTYKNIEVIVSDDQSKDATVAICNQFRSEVDFPVHIHSHFPSGIGANWNHAIGKAKGDYIKILFQDDVMEAGCIEEMLKYLTDYKLDIVVCKRHIIDADSHKVTQGEWYENFHDLQEKAGIEVNGFFILSRKNLKDFNFNRYSVDNIIGEPCVSLFTRDLINRIGPFNIQLKQILDYEYWLRVLIKYDIGIIGKKLIRFRYHAEQTSNINSTQNVDERYIITNLLYGKLLFHISRSHAKYYIKQKYPLLKKLIAFRYKIFP